MIKTVKIRDLYIFPIFKNGKSSIDQYAEKNKCRWLINEQSNRADYINVFIRNPKERFISGVHSFIEFERRKNPNLDYETMLYVIENHGVINEHYQAQYFWIKSLAEFYKGEIMCRPIKELYTLIPNRDKPRIPDISQSQYTRISKIVFKDIQYDEAILKNHLLKKISIEKFIKDVKNTLSST